VTNELLAAGADVVISGLDTTEALTRAGELAAAGEPVWALPYNFDGGCAAAPQVCVGVPYFNWGPAYRDTAQSVIDGEFEATWQWLGPDWNDINDPDRSAVGFLPGDGLSVSAKADLDDFIVRLGGGGIQLYVGPLRWQDGTLFLADGEHAADFQIWYTEQLLEGIIGDSTPSG
jgi:simple sugar transport system substrate-binding protein